VGAAGDGDGDGIGGGDGGGDGDGDGDGAVLPAFVVGDGMPGPAEVVGVRLH
jgi:hypothetical protein